MRMSIAVLCGAVASMLALAGPAHATQSISCTDMKFDSSVDILLGAGPVSNVLAVSISMGEHELTTEPSLPGEQVAIAQAFDDGEIFRIDLIDLQATRLVAAIRLILAEDDAMSLRVGYVRIGGEPPVGVSCEGP